MAKVRVDNLVEGNIVMHSHGVEDLDSTVTDKFVEITGDTMTGALNVQEGVATDALVVKDDSGNKKWSIQHNTNTVKQDFYSPEPDNKIVNSGFETDLSSWTEDLGYVLNDEFTTDLPAGSVNGTLATDGVNTRTVVDTTNKLNINSGLLNFTGGLSTPAWGNPGIWYPQVARTPGKTQIIQFYPKVSSLYGFDNNQSGDNLNYESFYYGNGNLFYVYTGGSNRALGTLDPAISYQLAVTLRSTGAYYYLKGGAFNNWTLIWVTNLDSTTTLYPSIIGYNSTTETHDFLRIPTATWLPTPLAYDTFTRADGTIGSSETTGPDGQTTPQLSWTNGAISSNKMVITPTLGSELIVNGGFDTDTAWTKDPTWTISGGVGIATSAGSGDNIRQSILTTGSWYQNTFDLVTFTSGIFRANFGGSAGPNRTSVGTYTITDRAVGTSGGIRSSAVGTSGTIDDISFKPLTLSSLFSTVSTSDANVILGTEMTMTPGTQAGVVLSLDSTSNPQNFVIFYHDGINMKIEKCVNGTYTTLYNATPATYISGRPFTVIKDGTTYRFYYNNALVDTKTISDAGIINNTKHGLFSTYEGNSFDNFTLFPRGSDNEYSDAPFEELTATRDTDVKYLGEASVKLVAGGTHATYLQSVNVGDTNSHSLVAYAYTDGSAVTTADLNLWYDGAELTTSFTSMGAGWYRLTGTLTGVASAKTYGVKVKAGKTVYVDTVSLQAGAGATIEVTFENSGSGVANATFENDLTVGGNINGIIDDNL